MYKRTSYLWSFTKSKNLLEPIVYKMKIQWTAKLNQTITLQQTKTIPFAVSEHKRYNDCWKFTCQTCYAAMPQWSIQTKRKTYNTILVCQCFTQHQGWRIQSNVIIKSSFSLNSTVLTTKTRQNFITKLPDCVFRTQYNIALAPTSPEQNTLFIILLF